MILWGSFMQNTKKIKIIAVILAVMLAVEALCVTYLSDNYKSLYWNKDIARIVDSGENVEMIFMGTSRMFQGISPGVIEEEMDYQNVCDGASPQQDIKGRYYLLKDMLEDFTPKYVVLEAGMNSLKEEQRISAKRTTMDRITSIKNRIGYFIDDFEPGDILSFLPSIRFLKGESLDEIIAKVKRRNAYFKRGGVPEPVGSVKGQDEYYVKNGYVYDLDTDGAEWRFHLAVDLDAIDYDQVEYYQKMIDMCREKNIEVLMISLPIPRRQLYDAENYMGAYDFYREIARKNDIFYVNLNFHKELGETLVDTDYADDLHLNGVGSEIASRVYCDILKLHENGVDTSDLFYTDLDDMGEDLKGIISVNANLDYNARKKTYTLSIKSAQPDRMTPEYKYQLIDKESGDIIFESDYSEESEIDLDKDRETVERSKIRVFARSKGTDLEYDCDMEFTP